MVTLYHGSTEVIREFDVNHTWGCPAVFATPSIDLAWEYATSFGLRQRTDALVLVLDVNLDDLDEEDGDIEVVDMPSGSSLIDVHHELQDVAGAGRAVAWITDTSGTGLADYEVAIFDPSLISLREVLYSK